MSNEPIESVLAQLPDSRTLRRLEADHLRTAGLLKRLIPVVESLEKRSARDTTQTPAIAGSVGT